MARATSGLGQFRGKVGSVVFRVSQGQQIASAYQPAVKNPKSNLQTAQRNKMYLASQISKLVPREDILGLAPRGSVRDRRSMFIRNIIDNATSSLDGEVFASSVNPYELRFSKGGDINQKGVSVGVADTTGTITLTFDKAVISEDDFNKLAIKVIQFDVINGFYQGYKSSWLDLGTYDTSNQSTFDVTFNVTKVNGGYSIVYIVPVTLNDGYRYSREKKTLIQVSYNGEVESVFTIRGEYSISNAVLQWYESQCIYITSDNGTPVLPPTGNGDEVINPDGPNFPNLG